MDELIILLMAFESRRFGIRVGLFFLLPSALSHARQKEKTPTGITGL
jgi:hypothetical protein